MSTRLYRFDVRTSMSSEDLRPRLSKTLFLQEWRRLSPRYWSVILDWSAHTCENTQRVQRRVLIDLNYLNCAGVCECYPGWTGANCTIPCPEGTYGNNCSQRCKCQNGGRCRANDGVCKCQPGWVGTHCTDSTYFVIFVVKIENSLLFYRFSVLPCMVSR